MESNATVQTPAATEASESVAEHLPPPRTCPFCAELIQAAAIRCKHCGADLARQPRPPVSARSTIGVVFFGVLTLLSFAATAVLWVAYSSDAAKIPLVVWRSVLCFGMVVICIGAHRRTAWGRDWVMGTSLLQGVSFLYGLIAGWDKGVDEAPWMLGLLGFGAAAAAAAFTGALVGKAEYQSEARADTEGGLLTTRPVSRASLWITIGLFVVAAVVESLAR
jgi:hypothetical protein